MSFTPNSKSSEKSSRFWRVRLWIDARCRICHQMGAGGGGWISICSACQSLRFMAGFSCLICHANHLTSFIDLNILWCCDDMIFCHVWTHHPFPFLFSHLTCTLKLDPLQIWPSQQFLNDCGVKCLKIFKYCPWNSTLRIHNFCETFQLHWDG